MSEIIVIADLGNFKAYKVTRDPLGLKSDKIEMMRSFVFIEPHAKSSEKFSDKAGRFYIGSGKKGTTAGFGEPHNIETEARKKLIKQFSEEINTLVASEDCDRWYLAADKVINSQIIKKLRPAVKARLKKNIKSNLTKIAKSRLMSYFA
ncbi:MAG: host attachment protein [Nitrospirota bacterium]